jgi:hypothetical protein
MLCPADSDPRAVFFPPQQRQVLGHRYETAMTLTAIGLQLFNLITSVYNTLWKQQSSLSPCHNMITNSQSSIKTLEITIHF